MNTPVRVFPKSLAFSKEKANSMSVSVYVGGNF